MTIEELKSVAESEMALDGILSKGVRIAAIEKAREGKTFILFGSSYDKNAIRTALFKSGDSKRVKTRTLDKGKRFLLQFN